VVGKPLSQIADKMILKEMHTNQNEEGKKELGGTKKEETEESPKSQPTTGK
jgi:hypothetical protein